MLSIGQTKSSRKYLFSSRRPVVVSERDIEDVLLPTKVSLYEELYGVGP